MHRGSVPFAVGCTLLAASLFAQQPAHVITGSVTAPSGAPIEGATVELQSPSYPFMETAHTNSAGRYRFSALPAGFFTVTLRHSFASPVRSQRIRLEDDRPAGEFNAILTIVAPQHIVSTDRDGGLIVVQSPDPTPYLLRPLPIGRHFPSNFVGSPR